jgi:AraC family transcriptional regulator, ethanolamine operon transcriptional activator
MIRYIQKVQFLRDLLLSMPMIFCHEFQDLDSLEAIAFKLGLDSKINQMSRGKLQGRFLTLKLGQLHFLQLDFNQMMTIRGAKPPGCFIFSVTLEQEGKELRTHGKVTPLDYLYGTNPDLDIYLLTPTRFKYVIVIIPQTFLLNYLVSIGKETLFSFIRDNNWLQIPIDKFSPLKVYLTEIFHLAVHQPLFLENGDRQNLVVKDFLPLLLDCMPGASSQIRAFERHNSRVTLVKQAEAMMGENLEQPITLTDIYQALHTSRRTLIYAFNDVVGMTPIAYVKTLRLNAVHRKLLVSDPERVSVSQVAHYYGFWSAGHFARDYRAFFGESPSQTLNYC